MLDLVAPGAREQIGAGFCGARPKNGKNQLPSGERRKLLLALLAWPVAAHASTDPLAGLERWGSGEYRRFGFLIYEASLWAGADARKPPLALRLDYRRNISGQAIAAASVNEMRRFVSDEVLLNAWGEQMASIFPDVKAGDHLLGVYRGDAAHFYQGERLIGSISTPGFAAAFFAIWLDARTSAPALRAALLRREGGGANAGTSR